LIILGHYVILVLIIVELVLVFGARNCEKARHENQTNGDCTIGAEQDEGEAYVIVIIVLWLCMHICGGFMRRNVYYDSFFYQPEDITRKWKNWLFVRCGP